MQMFGKLWNVFQQQNMCSVCEEIPKTPMIAHVKTELVKCHTTWDVKWACMQSYWTSCTKQFTYTKQCVYEFSETLLVEITNFILENIPEHCDEMVLYFERTGCNTMKNFEVRAYLREIESDLTRSNLMFQEVFKNKFFVAIVISLCKQYKCQYRHKRAKMVVPRR